MSPNRNVCSLFLFLFRVSSPSSAKSKTNSSNCCINFFHIHSIPTTLPLLLFLASLLPSPHHSSLPLPVPLLEDDLLPSPYSPSEGEEEVVAFDREVGPWGVEGK